MIPKNKLKRLQDNLKNQGNPASSNPQSGNSMFFKANLEGKTPNGKTGEATYELLVFTPEYALPKYKDIFSSNKVFDISIPVFQHNIKISDKKTYNMNCHNQSRKDKTTQQWKSIPFIGLDPKTRCPICGVGYDLKSNYYAKTEKEKAEYGSWDNIPADTLADFKAERKMWDGCLYKKERNNVVGIYVQKKSDGTYVAPTTVTWQTAPKKLTEAITGQYKAGSFIFAEDYDENENILMGTPFKPSKIISMDISEKKPLVDYYTVTILDNDDYMLTRLDDDTIQLESKSRGINVTLKIPDMYAYLGDYFAKYDSNEGVKEFLDKQSVKRIGDTPTFVADETPSTDQTPTDVTDTPTFDPDNELDNDEPGF